MRTFAKIALAATSLLAMPALAQSHMPHDGNTPTDQTAPMPSPSSKAPTMTGSEEALLAKCRARPANDALNDPVCVAATKDKLTKLKEGGADNHNGTPHGQPAPKQ